MITRAVLHRPSFNSFQNWVRNPGFTCEKIEPDRGLRLKMMRVCLAIGSFALFSATALAQSAGAPPANAPGATANPTFIIAGIRPSPHRRYARMMGPILRGDRYFLRQAPMRDLVGLAYGVNPGYVQGGPKWLEMDRYDIDAKMPPGSTKDTARQMLRALLVERFSLVAHDATISAPARVLTVSKDGVKMKQGSGSDDAGCQFKPEPDPGPGAVSYMQIACHNITMATFVQTLHNFTYDYWPGPIGDATGLKGAWDFNLKWSNRSQLAMAGAEGINVEDAVEKQLGLKFDRQMEPRPVITVDSVNETPSPNSPDLAKLLPPLPPPEIEVATIKPSQHGNGGMFRFNGVEFNMQSLNLKTLIYFAWDLDFGDDEVLAGAPKWIDSDRFDIVAKLNTGTDGGAAEGPPLLDDDDIRRLLRGLLVDRFEIKSHFENRPITAFKMVAANPKLTKADPMSHTRCGTGPGPGNKDPRLANPALDQLVVCQNMTMAEIADKFQEIAPGYIYGAVRDATGIKGSWDFTLAFSSSWVANAGAGGGMVPPSGSGQPAADPNGAISFFDAVDKQLGLKLDKEKRSLPVLVIDHIDEQPTEN